MLVDTPVDRELLERLVRAYRPRDTDILFVSGSRLEGLGNTRSDYDLYVILTQGGAIEPYVTVVLDDTYAVFETFDSAHVARVAQTVNETAVDDPRAVWALSSLELEFYYRMIIGAPLTRADAFCNLQTPFRREVINRVVHAWCGLRAAVALDESSQKLALGDQLGAYFAAQRAASWAVDAYLAACGESYPGFKWRFEKLRRGLGETNPVFKRAWQLKALGEQSIASYIAAVDRLCADLNMANFQSWSLGDTTLRRSDTARAVRYRERDYIVDNNTALYQLSPQGRRIWDRIDGQVLRKDLIASAMTADTTAADVTAWLFELEENGLIR